MTVPGGFGYTRDTGSGKIIAHHVHGDAWLPSHLVCAPSSTWIIDTRTEHDGPNRVTARARDYHHLELGDVVRIRHKP